MQRQMRQQKIPRRLKYQISALSGGKKSDDLVSGQCICRILFVAQIKV
jgi:hypothetical protein